MSSGKACHFASQSPPVKTKLGVGSLTGLGRPSQSRVSQILPKLRLTPAAGFRDVLCFMIVHGRTLVEVYLYGQAHQLLCRCLSSRPSVTYKVVAPYGLQYSPCITTSSLLIALVATRCPRGLHPVDPPQRRLVRRSARLDSPSLPANSTAVGVYPTQIRFQDLIVDQLAAHVVCEGLYTADSSRCVIY